MAYAGPLGARPASTRTVEALASALRRVPPMGPGALPGAARQREMSKKARPDRNPPSALIPCFAADPLRPDSRADAARVRRHPPTPRGEGVLRSD